MTRTRNPRRGNAVLEFTLVGIPVVFVLISIFEVSRGMWIYHTLAHAAREGTRFAIVHGQNCGTLPTVCDKSVADSCCKKTVADIAAVIRDAGAGLIPEDLTVTIRNTNVFGANFDTVGPAFLSTLLSDNTEWPTGTGSSPGNDIEITLTYPFRSAIALFWPGAGPVTFGTFNLPATSQDRIQF
jgi:Flp pilus assembly protein TadG